MNEERQARLNQALEHILLTLAAEYRPEKVILFGSMAQAAVGEWSDLDLVIIKDTSKPFLQRLKEVALLCRAPVGVDYLVYTPDEFAQMIADRNPFILEEVLRKGKVLYEYESMVLASFGHHVERGWLKQVLETTPFQSSRRSSRARLSCWPGQTSITCMPSYIQHNEAMCPNKNSPPIW